MAEQDDVHDHLSNFMDVVDQLSAMGMEIHPKLLSIMMLHYDSPPQTFENFRIAIETRDCLLNPDYLKIKIIEESEGKVQQQSRKR